VRSTDRLLFVGRLNRQKGLALLLRALAATETGAALDVIGAGQDESELRQLTGELGLTERVSWLAPRPQPQLAEFYRRAAALIVPSVDEGLGLVAVEGLLCEAPVIAFASGGVPDSVRHDLTGILVPPGDVRALGGAIDGLLRRPDRGAALGRAGRLHALAVFAPASVARRYVEIYQSALASRAA